MNESGGGAILDVFYEPAQREFDVVLDDALLKRARGVGDSKVGEVNIDVSLLWPVQT